jgi:hypothetical protein
MRRDIFLIKQRYLSDLLYYIRSKNCLIYYYKYIILINKYFYLLILCIYNNRSQHPPFLQNCKLDLFYIYC